MHPWVIAMDRSCQDLIRALAVVHGTSTDRMIGRAIAVGHRIRARERQGWILLLEHDTHGAMTLPRTVPSGGDRSTLTITIPNRLRSVTEGYACLDRITPDRYVECACFRWIGIARHRIHGWTPWMIHPHRQASRLCIS
jgi:hypothetical protein